MSFTIEDLFPKYAPPINHWTDTNWSIKTVKTISSPLVLATETYPEIDIIEEEERVVVRVDVPGFSKNDLTISSLDDDALVIEGKATDRSESGGQFLMNERQQQEDFRRVITVGKGVDFSASKASLQNGVLEIVLGKVLKDNCTITIE